MQDFADGPEREDPVRLATADLGLDLPPFMPTRRIFVNRNLRFEHISRIGFDMDYTLAPYVKRTIEALAFRLTAERMVQTLGYPEKILTIPYNPDFAVRGLVVDKRLGNVFKMDRHKHVGRVYHGGRKLSKDERRHLYRSAKIRLTAPRYHKVDTLFALPEVILYAGIIDLYELDMGIDKVAYWKLFEDIRTSIDTCHRDGSLKSVVKADIGKYIIADPELAATLHKLRSSGKRLFILTNSEWSYTNVVMSYLLDDKLQEYPRWLNYFDLVVVSAEKPAFFTEHRTFKKLDPQGRPYPGPVHRLEARGIYAGGSIRELERLQPGGDRVLYVGDHIYGDIIRSKRDSLWRNALVLQELESELSLTHELKSRQADVVALEEHRSRLDEQITALKLKVQSVDASKTDSTEDPVTIEGYERQKKQLLMSLDKKRKDLRTVSEQRDLLIQQIDQSYNPYWGSVFKEGSDGSRFGEQVENYACLYTSRVTNFLAYSPNQYFRAPRHWMPHEKDFE